MRLHSISSLYSSFTGKGEIYCTWFTQTIAINRATIIFCCLHVYRYLSIRVTQKKQVEKLPAHSHTHQPQYYTSLPHIKVHKMASFNHAHQRDNHIPSHHPSDIVLSFSLAHGLHWVIPGTHRHNFELAPISHTSSHLRHSRQSSKRHLRSLYCGSSSVSDEKSLRSMQRLSQLTRTTGNTSSLISTTTTHC